MELTLSYEVSKLAKEKGFSQESDNELDLFYYEQDLIQRKDLPEDAKDICKAVKAEAMDEWLIRNYNISIKFQPCFNLKYTFWVAKYNNLNYETLYVSPKTYLSPLNCCNDGYEYVLNNQINNG